MPPLWSQASCAWYNLLLQLLLVPGAKCVGSFQPMVSILQETTKGAEGHCWQLTQLTAEHYNRHAVLSAFAFPLGKHHAVQAVLLLVPVVLLS